MIIYSWNMLFRNPKLEEAFVFIQNANADIFCLQEVPEQFARRLRELPYHIASGSETDRFSREGVCEHHELVVLSRYPITKTQVLPLPSRDVSFSRRGKFFIWLMTRVAGWWHTGEKRDALMVELQTPAGKLQVYNLHLTLTNPQWRLEEFESALANREIADTTIVCGDLNTVEKPHITPLNWMFGGTLSDVFCYKRERINLEKRFAEHTLMNPLYGKTTHSLSQSQLDHILVSDTFSVKEASVLQNRYGSDHNPIRVQVT